MSNPWLSPRKSAAQPKLPRGDVLGAYETYAEAQAVVDRLAKREFDVSRVAIVGSDLKTVERVTGKLTYARAALAGAASGAWFGLFFGLLLVLFAENPNLLFAGAAALIGAGFGMLFGLATYSMNRRKRDFTSMTQVLASRYEILVDPQQLELARDVLARPDTAD